jgi:hypothetical protein
MSLARKDANRIIRFCLAGVGGGTALREDELCVVRISRAAPPSMEVQTFTGNTFDEALRQAAHSGAIKPTCLEKQMAFLAASGSEHQSDLIPAPSGLVHASRLATTTDPLFATLTGVISALVHETQLERGISALYLASASRALALDLKKQWRMTDEHLVELAVFQQHHRARLPSAVTLRLDRALALLKDVCGTRREIESLQLAPARVIERYSSANDYLLSVIASLGQLGVDAALRPPAIAWIALLYAKEKTGIERAQLASAFTRDRYDEGQHSAVSALIGSTESYLLMFSAVAPLPARQLLEEALRSEVVQVVGAMENVAMVRCQGGFGINPSKWFNSITRKIDLLAHVEASVRTSLSRERY